ncbi:23878_t:CDS:10 [Dentiscutata erythropus]|uniref:23878_t:CDS:1 n=1 Tax=Dentiscutata erythropus TaxID=1348616 RepID=A0A9N9BN20_9GLOM|nr:23878_t:CDS:10 [Dentiscutata erythropus]
MEIAMTHTIEYPQPWLIRLPSILKLKKFLLITSFIGAFITLFIFYDLRIAPYAPYKYNHFIGISEEAYRNGVIKCNMIKSNKPNNEDTNIRTSNPRFVPGTKTIVFKNGIILNGKGEKILGDIILKNGLIHAIGQNLSDDNEAIVIDVKKKYITPGLVDMHSHAAVTTWPSLTATDDSNEITNPLTPYVRAQDAINPSDPQIRIIASGGITTSLIIPGSSNLMGGEGYVIKMRPVDTLSVDDMGINANIDTKKERSWRWLKMACGENPKMLYKSLKQIPTTRLGEAWLFRKMFAEAQALKQKQDDWCSAAAKSSNGEQLNSYFPEDLQFESLVALLRGDAKLNVHCHESYDTETMIRISLEFNFTITALHHVTNAYKITGIIKKRVKNNITVAIFPDLYGHKKEAIEASTKAPKIFVDAQIPVALKSDHPITNAQNLAFQAAKAYHYGLDENQTLAAITSVPAKALGLGHRIGQISLGYDADVVVMQCIHCATPLEVYIDGIPQFNTSLSVLSNETSKQSLSDNIPKSDFARKPVKSRTTSSVILKNIDRIYVDKNHSYSSVEGNISIIVKDGIIECIGINCTIPSNLSSYEIIDLNGGHVLPGIIAFGPALGLAEIEVESYASDGQVDPINNPNDVENIIYAVDGLKFGGKHLEAAYKAGVLTAVTAPLSSKSAITGVSIAFKTGARSIFNNEPIISENVALHAKIGTPYKDDRIPTVSGQISLIRRTLIKNLAQQNIIGRVARGDIPLIVYVDSKDEIATLIKLKIHIKNLGGNLKLVIAGGAEAHMLAIELAENEIPVILNPSRPTPRLWTAQHVLTGAPITNKTGIDILYENNVKIGIGVDLLSEGRRSYLLGFGLERDLIWDAGWVSRNSKGLISQKDAIGFITWNLKEILGLKMRNGLLRGSIANFVAYNGNPFDISTKVKIVAGGGRSDILIDPEQD